MSYWPSPQINNCRCTIHQVPIPPTLVLCPKQLRECVIYFVESSRVSCHPTSSLQPHLSTPLTPEYRQRKSVLLSQSSNHLSTYKGDLHGMAQPAPTTAPASLGESISMLELGSHHENHLHKPGITVRITTRSPRIAMRSRYVDRPSYGQA